MVNFNHYFDQQQGLVNEAIEQSRIAQQLQDPYFSRAEEQYGLGLSDTLSGIDQSRDLMTGAVDRFGNRLSDVEARRRNCCWEIWSRSCWY